MKRKLRVWSSGSGNKILNWRSIYISTFFLKTRSTTNQNPLSLLSKIDLKDLDIKYQRTRRQWKGHLDVDISNGWALKLSLVARSELADGRWEQHFRKLKARKLCLIILWIRYWWNIYRVDKKKGWSQKHGYNYSEIHQKGIKLVCFGKWRKWIWSWQPPSKNR